MIDLHSHSAASDGLLSPADSARYACGKGLSVWALTDHDTISGLTAAQEVCRESGVTFVPGIEITVDWPTGEFHLLGLGLTHCSDEMNELIEELTRARVERNEQILEKMKKELNLQVTLEELREKFGCAQIGRPHIASFLVDNKIVKTRQAAFDKYLAQGRPWYSRHHGARLDDAVEAIKTSGGVPVLAHPLSLYVSWGKIEGVLTQIRDAGVEGFEAWHPGARVGEAIRLEELARKLGCFVTAGSDFHGEGVRADRRLGKTSGGKKIEDRFWTDELLPHISTVSFEA